MSFSIRNYLVGIIACLTISILFFSCNKQQPASRPIADDGVHSLESELDVFHDIRSLPKYFENIVDAQISSYDTTWRNDDGFNGTYSFLKRNADSSLVIFDAKGSGVINRIWTPTPTEDTLDFFIDGDRPTFSIKFSDLFSGKQFPFVAPLCGNQLGGFYCYLPITFQKNCKVISRGKKIQFHQIQYRLFPDGTKVKTFSMELSDNERSVLNRIDTLWNKSDRSIRDFYSGEILESHKEINLASGETKTIFENQGGGRILGFTIQPAQAFEGLSKNLDIKITWDNENSPAVYCPAADFFGYAFGAPSMQSLLIGTKDKLNYCYFPMPFDKSAKIEFIRRESGPQKVPVKLGVKVWYSTEKINLEREGKFYAHWNNDQPGRGRHHVFLDAKGKGHYVGTILQSQGLKAGMTLFFEGDDSTAIDGDFRMHGTGSEDYFNGGWYALLDRWDGKMSLPLHGALDYSLPFARTGGYRLFLSDKMSFQNSLYHSIEHGPVGSAFPVEYTSIAFYYSDAPPASVAKISDGPLTVTIPDTLIIYPQLMDYNIANSVNVKTTWQYGTGGESYFFTVGDESWLRISLKDIPRGSYRLSFDVQKKPDGCAFSVWQRQTQRSPWLSTNQPAEERVKDLYVCDLDIKDFQNTITLRFKTDARMNSLLLHRITLIKQ